MIKFPYAIRDFDKLITNKYFYIDRTDRIPLIEDFGHELIFLRPRGFGKSLLISMLMNYYDAAKADKFELLFGDLAIGKNPTPLHSQYLVMGWNFAEIDYSGNLDQIMTSVNEHINSRIEQFAAHYDGWFTYPITVDYDDAIHSFNSLLIATRTSPYQLYLFIDEYDGYTTPMMIAKRGKSEKWYDMMKYIEGTFTTIFQNIKSAGSGYGLNRVFATGTLPIVHNASVSRYLTWRFKFNDLCGFREEEVIPLVNQIASEHDLPSHQVDLAVESVQIHCAGSRFTSRDIKDTDEIYNPTSTLHFLQLLQEGRLPDLKRIEQDKFSIHKVLAYIFDHDQAKQILLDALSDEATLKAFMFRDHFLIDELLTDDKLSDHLISLLCYVGALTVKDKDRMGNSILQIPNLVMKQLWEEVALN